MKRRGKRSSGKGAGKKTRAGAGKKGHNGKAGGGPSSGMKWGATKKSRAVKGGGPAIIGFFQSNPQGYGFVRPDSGEEEDLFIPARYVNDAIHGDRVEARIRERGPEGKTSGEVLRVLEHGDSVIIGAFDGEGVTPRDDRLRFYVRVHAADSGEAEVGDVVMVRVTKRNARGIHGKVLEVLGAAGDPGLEARVALRSRGFSEEFLPEVLAEADSFPDGIPDSEVAGRTDLRDIFTVTIDPETARDFDDALAIERSKGGFKAWVSIADVSHYVTPGSAMDDEAYERATSVYLPGRCVPMLPGRLSSNLCSLMPEKDRPAVTVEMDFSASGLRKRARMYRSVIRSDHRLTYDQVEAMAEDPGLREQFPGAWEAIKIMRELAERRGKVRASRGSIDLDVPEAEVVLDESGEVTDVLRREQTWSHGLVEEFMLAANEAVASFMTDARQPMVYRIHEPPPPGAVESLAAALGPFGIVLYGRGSEPEHIKPSDYQRVIDQSRDTPYGRAVKILCLRSMSQARYSAEPIMHFGLAAPLYCHFTSPIRRYPDLIVHRLLVRLMESELGAVESGEEKAGGAIPEQRPEGGGREAAPEELSRAALHCSERERAAEDAEREMVDVYCAMYAARHLGEVHKGIVSGVARFGLFVELSDVFIEGLVPSETISRDVYYVEEKMTLSTPEGDYRVGDDVVVVIHSASVEKRRINFVLKG